MDKDLQLAKIGYFATYLGEKRVPLKQKNWYGPALSLKVGKRRKINFKLSPPPPLNYYVMTFLFLLLYFFFFFFLLLKMFE